MMNKLYRKPAYNSPAALSEEKESLPIVGPNKGRVLADVIRAIKPKRVLEVGTLTGYSAILMGKELGNEAQLVTIENHADEAKICTT